MTFSVTEEGSTSSTDSPAHRDADVAERVVATHPERGQGQEERIGGQRLVHVELRQRDREGKTRTGEDRLDLVVRGAQEGGEVPGAEDLVTAAHDDADGRRRVLRDDGTEGIERRGDADDVEADLAELTGRRLREAWLRGRKANNQRQTYTLRLSEPHPTLYSLGNGSSGCARSHAGARRVRSSPHCTTGLIGREAYRRVHSLSMDLAHTCDTSLQCHKAARRNVTPVPRERPMRLATPAGG